MESEEVKELSDGELLWALETLEREERDAGTPYEALYAEYSWRWSSEGQEPEDLTRSN